MIDNYSKVIAYKSLPDITSISTSGGAFLGIVRVFFETYKDKMCKVYSVVMEDGATIKYAVATNFEECKKFCGSKYVFCDMNNIIHDIKQDLTLNNPVLFVGTPCQVFSIMQCLKSDNIDIKDFFTIDLICNGAPSKKFWSDYKKWIEKKYHDTLEKFEFRLSGDPFNPYRTRAVFKSGKIVTDSVYTASYNQMFLKKLSIRKSCFSCKFKSVERYSDLTLGDFWGAKYIFNEITSDYKLSEIIINTSKGRMFVDKLQGYKNELFLESQSYDYVKYQKNLRGGSEIPQCYDDFWNLYESRGIALAIAKYSDANYCGFFVYKLKKIYRKLKRKLKKV